MFAIILFRITLLNLVYLNTYSESDDGEQSIWFSQARLLTSLVASTMNLIVIIILNKVYEYVALWLVKFEQPRTQTDFEHSYTFKMFCFQFINFYLPLIYIACFKVKKFIITFVLIYDNSVTGKVLSTPRRDGQGYIRQRILQRCDQR